jgi:hypothetical protein
LVLISVGLWGCAPVEDPPIADLDGDGLPDDLPEGTVDLRIDFPEPAGDNFLVLELDDLLILPGTERFFCKFGTWEGEDVGVISLVPVHTEEFHHHSLIKGPRDPNQELESEGSVIDCSTQAGFEGSPVLFEGVGFDPQNPEDWINLPEGVAYPLRQDQRYYGDVHYINVTDDPILVNSGFVLELVPADEIDGYAGAFNHDFGGFSIPPAGDHHLQFDCGWQAETSILSLAGHMHHYGTSYSIDWNSAEGTEQIYEVPEWEEQYQFGSPTLWWDIGEFVVQAGDTFTTHCNWNNPHDEALAFPDEMCTTYGVAYPLEQSIHCDASGGSPGG